jgi:hypothetical protein
MTCEPRPRTKRPPEAFWRSQATCARIIGLRAEAIAIAVPRPIRDVVVEATARGRNGSWRVSADQMAGVRGHRGEVEAHQPDVELHGSFSR